MRRESHLRSIVKGISWRIVASSTTVLVVVLVSSFFGEIQFANALKIASSEFFLKLAIYYVHERTWQNFIGYEGHTRRMLLIKSITWRVIASCMTIVLSWMFLDKHLPERVDVSISTQATIIGILDFILKFTFFYLHELIWHSLPYGRLRKWLSIIFQNDERK